MITLGENKQTSERSIRWAMLGILLIILIANRAFGQTISPEVSGAAVYALTTEMATNDAMQHAAFDGALIAVRATAHTPAEEALVLALQNFAIAHRQHLNDYGWGRVGTKADYYEYLRMTGQPLPKCGKKQPNCHASDAAEIAKDKAAQAAAYAAVQADMAFAQAWKTNLQNQDAAQPEVK